MNTVETLRCGLTNANACHRTSYRTYRHPCNTVRNERLRHGLPPRPTGRTICKSRCRPHGPTTPYDKAESLRAIADAFFLAWLPFARHAPPEALCVDAIESSRHLGFSASGCQHEPRNMGSHGSKSKTERFLWQRYLRSGRGSDHPQSVIQMLARTIPGRPHNEVTKQKNPCVPELTHAFERLGLSQCCSTQPLCILMCMLSRKNIIKRGNCRNLSHFHTGIV